MGEHTVGIRATRVRFSVPDPFWNLWEKPAFVQPVARSDSGFQIRGCVPKVGCPAVYRAVGVRFSVSPPRFMKRKGKYVKEIVRYGDGTDTREEH